jgi:hypothetical protein
VPLADGPLAISNRGCLGLITVSAAINSRSTLDEFVFRHNRRKTPMAAFQTLLGLGSGHKLTKYEEIRGASDLGEPPTDS